MEETNRQRKIAGIIQEDLANTLQEFLRAAGTTGVLISVTKVSVTPDLGVAKAYLSIFPSNKSAAILKEAIEQRDTLRYNIAQKVKNQLRRMPELLFFNDDSLDYIDQIDRSLRGEENPIEDPSLLAKRKKL